MSKCFVITGPTNFHKAFLKRCLKQVKWFCAWSRIYTGCKRTCAPVFWYTYDQSCYWTTRRKCVENYFNVKKRRKVNNCNVASCIDYLQLCYLKKNEQISINRCLWRICTICSTNRHQQLGHKYVYFRGYFDMSKIQKNRACDTVYKFTLYFIVMLDGISVRCSRVKSDSICLVLCLISWSLWWWQNSNLTSAIFSHVVSRFSLCVSMILSCSWGIVYINRLFSVIFHVKIKQP